MRRDARAALQETLGPLLVDELGLSASLFRAYAKASDDPDTDLANWLKTGAHMGIPIPITHRGIFPQVDGRGPASRAEAQRLATDGSEWENYRSAESDPEVCAGLFDRMALQGWARSCDTVSQAQASIGGAPLLLNKLVLITNRRPDGLAKHRLVWDLRRSGVNGLVNQGERIVLPRISVLLQDLRSLHPDLAPDLRGSSSSLRRHLRQTLARSKILFLTFR